LDPKWTPVETIASRVDRSPQYVSGRLRLIQLIPEAKQAFYDDKLTVAHAFEIARLQPLFGGIHYVAFSWCTGAGEESKTTECHITLLAKALGETPSVPCHDAMVWHACRGSPRRGPRPVKVARRRVRGFFEWDRPNLAAPFEMLWTHAESQEAAGGRPANRGQT
jgi:hypothetical protein